MGEVLAVLSGKGGTGKTSVCAGLATALAREGKRVLCVDCDVGLRNLDISLGLTDSGALSFLDVCEGGYSLEQAAIHPLYPSLRFLTAPVNRPVQEISQTAFSQMLRQARTQFDYILIDSPAGLGGGFRLATCGADRAVVVSTNDSSALRDAQRTVVELSRSLDTIHLVMNRIQPKLLRRLHTTIDDAMDTAGLPLLGVVPEDSQVILAANTGEPLILFSRKGAALAYLNIAKRLMGQRVPLMKIR